MKAITRLYVMANGKVGPAGTGRAVERFCRVGAEITEDQIKEHPELRAYVDAPPRKRAETKPRTAETKPVTPEEHKADE